MSKWWGVWSWLLTYRTTPVTLTEWTANRGRVDTGIDALLWAWMVVQYGLIAVGLLRGAVEMAVGMVMR